MDKEHVPLDMRKRITCVRIEVEIPPKLPICDLCKGDLLEVKEMLTQWATDFDKFELLRNGIPESLTTAEEAEEKSEDEKAKMKLKIEG